MSRSDPFIIKPKCAKSTALFFCEGQTDEAFIKYLKTLYNRNSGLFITTSNAGGFDPEYIIETGITRFRGIGYDHGYIILDTDKKWPPESIKKAERYNIKLIGCTPCIEGLYLLILEPSFNPESLSSAQCKAKFEHAYLNKHHKLDWRHYAKIFPINILEEAKKRILILDIIINIVSNK